MEIGLYNIFEGLEADLKKPAKKQERRKTEEVAKKDLEKAGSEKKQERRKTEEIAKKDLEKEATKPADGKLDFLDVTLIMDQLPDEDYIEVCLYRMYARLEADIPGLYIVNSLNQLIF